MTRTRKLSALLFSVLMATVTQVVSPSSAFALGTDEQALILYDQQCESLAVDDCATYDPTQYDPNWRTFEDPVTGEDYLTTNTADAAGNAWNFQRVTTAVGDVQSRDWVCAGVAAKPAYQLSFIQGEAQQTCTGYGWSPQRVIVAIQWKHTRRFWRDSWVTVAQTNGDLSYNSVTEEGAIATCPGRRSRTFRTVGVGYAANDQYGGPNGGGRDDSKEVKLPCDRTSY